MGDEGGFFGQDFGGGSHEDTNARRGGGPFFAGGFEGLDSLGVRFAKGE